jgi:CheY-like chemotaxis protein
VRAASAGPGRGCTFTVSLPLLPIHALPAAAQRHPNSSTAAPVIPESLPRLDGVTVLVVDDESDAREVAKRLLTSHGAAVATAASAEEAFELLKSSPPTVLVSDIGMPGEDGLSLIRRVRKLDDTSAGATPALALTAYARSEDRMAALLAGFQMHTAKPVEAPELLAMVASLAGRTSG